MPQQIVMTQKKRVRAIIFQGNKLVLLKRVKENETYFVVPGGLVESGETDRNALIRECREELGVDVEVRQLFLKRKFREQWEHFYFCSIQKGRLGTGHGPEFWDASSYEGTHKLACVSLERLPDINLRPLVIKEEIGVLYRACLSAFEHGKNIDRVDLDRRRSYFLKFLAKKDAARELKGYGALKSDYPVPPFVFCLQKGTKSVLVFEYEKSIDRRDGEPLADYFARQKRLNPRYDKIITLYKNVFFKTLGWDEGRAADVFFRDRITTRIKKNYHRDFLNVFQGKEFVLHKVRVTVDLESALRGLRVFFAKKRKTWTILSQGDPNDLNIGMKPILFDFFGGGRVPLMAEFAIFFWYNLAQGSYFSPTYHTQAFRWHTMMLSKKDFVRLDGSHLYHEPSVARQDAIKKYIEQIIQPLVKKMGQFDFYTEFKHYLAMRILAVFDLRKMSYKDQALSLLYLQFFYQQSVETFAEFKSLVSAVCPKASFDTLK